MVIALEKSQASDKLYCITKMMSSQVSLSPELATTDTAKVTCSWSDHISSTCASTPTLGYIIDSSRTQVRHPDKVHTSCHLYQRPPNQMLLHHAIVSQEFLKQNLLLDLVKYCNTQCCCIPSMHYYVYALVCMYVYIALVYMSHYLGFPWAVGAPFAIPLGPHYELLH